MLSYGDKYIYIYIYIYWLIDREIRVAFNKFPDFFVQACHDLFTNIIRSDFSLALEKLHPGTAGNDEAFLRHWPAVTAKKGIN